MINSRVDINQTAYFDTYILHNSQEYNVGKKKPLVVVIPGGGYAFTSDREAEPIALKFNSIGCHSVVLWYTVYDKVTNIPQNATIEAAKTIKYIREHAEEWCVDTDKIIVCGFSAGGNLALQISTKWNKEWLLNEVGATKEDLRVNLSVICYPAIHAKVFGKEEMGFAHNLIEKPNSANVRFYGTETPTKEDLDQYNIINYIDTETPPMFIWHTFEDVLTDVQNSIDLAYTLRSKDVPFELHIFEKGEHGLALCDRTTARKTSHHNSHVIKWFDLCNGWLSQYID